MPHFVELLNVSSANTQRVPGLHHEVKHGGVVDGVGDEVRGHSPLTKDDYINFKN